MNSSKRKYKINRKTVFRTNYGDTAYRVEKRTQVDADGNLIKNYFLIEGSGRNQKSVYDTDHFGDCVYAMFNRERRKKISSQQLTLTGE